MHPELYYVLHQQQERELAQRLARDLMRRETAPAAPARAAWGARTRLRRLAALTAGLTSATRARAARIQDGPAAVECRTAVCC